MLVNRHGLKISHLQDQIPRRATPFLKRERFHFSKAADKYEPSMWRSHETQLVVVRRSHKNSWLLSKLFQLKP